MPLHSKWIESLSLLSWSRRTSHAQKPARMSTLQPGNHMSSRQNQQARPSHEWQWRSKTMRSERVQLNVKHFDAKIVVFISCVVSPRFSQVNMIAWIIWMEEYHVNTLSWQICLLQILVHQLPAVLQWLDQICMQALILSIINVWIFQNAYVNVKVNLQLQVQSTWF